MINESDKSLFRSAVNQQMPIDKDDDKEETYNNKKHWNVDIDKEVKEGDVAMTISVANKQNVIKC